MVAAYDFASRVLGKFGSHNGSLLAAALSFYAAFAIFPLLLGLVALLSAVFAQERAEHLVFRYVGSILGSQTGFVASTLEGVHQARGAIGALSAVLLIWSARGLFTNLATTLDIVHGFVGPSGWQGQVRFNAKALAFAMGCGVAILAFSALYWGIGFLYATGIDLTGGSGQPPSWLGAVQNGGTILGLFGGLLLVYRYLPTGPVSWKEALLSGALGVALWYPVSIALSIYFTTFARLNVVYGSLSGLMAFYIWLNYTATILILAAEVGVTASRGNEEA